MNYIGSDIGSISVNTILLNEKKEVIEEYYDYSRGKPFNTLAKRLSKILKKHKNVFGTIALTGTGGKIASELLNGTAVNEIVAQSKAVMALYPNVRTVIEMGGEDSKLIFLEKKEVNCGMKGTDGRL